MKPERIYGLSTGAVARGDFAKGLEMAGQMTWRRAVELSALRESELWPLLDALPDLDLAPFDYVSIHAPSKYPEESERAIAKALLARTGSRNVVLHPDGIFNYALWRPFGSRLCIENLHKGFGHHAVDLQVVFEHLPEASLCLDLGHAMYVDAYLQNAEELCQLTKSWFKSRIKQMHISRVVMGKHTYLTGSEVQQLKPYCSYLPNVPVIVESVLYPGAFRAVWQNEIYKAQFALRDKLGSWQQE
jgi:hypothetical protein